MTAPAISVVLPTYNRAPVLGRAIRSVLAQTYSDLELLIVDDGSDDDTSEVVAAFDDPRIRYLPEEHRGSAAIARNIGIRASRGSLIAFQDSDDEWMIDKLERQMAVLEDAGEDTALICGGYLVYMANGSLRYMGADPRMQAGDWAPDNLYDFCFIAPTWLVRRGVLEAVGMFDEAMLNLEDWELAFRLYGYGRIVALDEALVLKHGGADGLNYRIAPRIASLQRIIQLHGEIWRGQPEVMARLYEELGRWRCRYGEVRRGRSDLWHALRLSPVSLRRWVYWAASLFGQRTYTALRSLWARR